MSSLCTQLPVMRNIRRFPRRVVGLAGLVLLACSPVHAQDTSTLLTDKIYQGSGVIDLLKNVSAGTLSSYLKASSGLLLGVDVNENAAGNETSNSLGVAIQSMTLRLTTTTGDFAFSDVFTSTTAVMKDANGVTDTHYTLFGQAGSSQLTSSTTGFNLSSFDDLVELRNVAFTGDILGAKLEVAFVQTATKAAGANESFFDFSGGFEDFALLSRADALQVEAATIGTADAPTTVTYTAVPITETILAPVVADTTPTTTTTTSTPTTEPVVVSTGAAAAPGAPLPPVGLFAAAACLLLFKTRRSATQTA